MTTDDGLRAMAARDAVEGQRIGRMRLRAIDSQLADIATARDDLDRRTHELVTERRGVLGALMQP